ncbi:S-layer homology domain-containing protein [Rubeoparvulum massiliense]|uniref:S-layer homology domain-containing protein n=1 Tax=Rubeoparvulum massiliense TaxID=1631346 RepID=UPI00065E7F0A|nr:S-layer homology domain-containing protein [Rubeoparvulum massiliense]
MNTWKKSAILMLVFALLVTMIPPLPKVQAITGAITIDQYGVANNIMPPMEKISKITTPSITISGNIQGITEDDIPYLYYVIEQVNESGTLVEGNRIFVRDNPAKIPMENGVFVKDRYEFDRVQLFEGVNKITVRYEKQGTIQESQPGYVIFRAAPTLYDLKVNGQEWKADKPYPETAESNTAVAIEGKGENLQEVWAKNTSDPERVVKVDPSRGQFYFNAGINPNSSYMLRLYPGDNYITLTGRGIGEDMYALERNLIYNTGAYSYNTKIALDTSEQLLAQQPAFNTEFATDPIQFKLNTDVRVPFTIDTNGNKTAKYTEVKVFINDENGTPIDIALTGGTSYELYEEFKLTDVSIPIHKNDVDAKGNVKLIVKFDDNNKRIYPFQIIKNDQLYITNAIANGTFLQDGNINLLTKTPVEFKVHVSKIQLGTDKNFTVKVGIDKAILDDTDKVDPTLITVNEEDSYYEIKFTDSEKFNNLSEGLHKIKIQVSNGTKTAELTYDVSYTPIPYVIFKSPYANQTFSEEGNITKITGYIMNFPYDSTVEEKITLKVGSFTKSLKELKGLTGYKLESRVDGIYFEIPTTKATWATGDGELFNKQGKTSIAFNFYSDTERKNVIAKSGIDIYMFTTKVPQFVNVMPIDNNTPAKFVKGNRPGVYHTTEDYIALQGDAINIKSLKMVVRKPNAKEENYYFTSSKYFSSKEIDLKKYDAVTDVKGFQTYLDNNTSRPHDERAKVKLAPTGTTIIELIAENDGLTTIQTIEIVKEPQTFRVIEPDLSKSNVVTTNILRVRVQAEGADKIIFNKKEAKKVVGETDVFEFYTKELKANKTNKIKVDVMRGEEKRSEEFEVIYADKVVPGAQYWTEFNGTIKAHSNMVQINVPKGTFLRRNDMSYTNYYLTPERQLVIAIADQKDGQVNRDGYSPDHGRGADLLQEPTERFFPISPLFWIDAGYIEKPRDEEHDITETIQGSGTLPYEGRAFYDREYKDLMVPITDNGKEVKLTLQYDEKIVDSGWPYVTVYHFHYYRDHRGIPGWRWENVGGVVDPKKHTITVPIKEFGYYQVMYMRRSFEDVISHPWARNNLDLMYSKGYMNNAAKNLFLPNETITRGEFATLLVKAFEIPLDYEGNLTFTDVYPSDYSTRGLYDYKRIETAARAGIIRGGLDGQFQPRNEITREDAAVMIARAAKIKLDSIEKAKPKLVKQFTDAGNIDDYAAPAVLSVVKAGMMAGKPHAAKEGEKSKFYYEPQGKLTRAEAATIAVNVLSNAKRIPKQ